MAQLTAQYLRDHDAKEFVVTTRTLSNAKALADTCHGQAVPFSELDQQLVYADIVITATNCQTSGSRPSTRKLDWISEVSPTRADERKAT